MCALRRFKTLSIVHSYFDAAPIGRKTIPGTLLLRPMEPQDLIAVCCGVEQAPSRSSCGGKLGLRAAARIGLFRAKTSGKGVLLICERIP